MLNRIKNILKDDCLNFSNKQTAPSAGRAPRLTGKGSSTKEKYVKPLEEVVKEADVQAPTASRSSQMQRNSLQNLSTELRQLSNCKNPANEVNCVLKDVVPAAEKKREIVAGRVSLAKNRQRLKENSTIQNEIIEEEKQAADIKYILNDDIPATKSNGQNSTGKVSPPKKIQRPKENSTMQKEMTDADQLAADIEYILSDDIPANESNGQNSAGKVPPPKQRQRPKETSTMQKEMTEEEKLAADIEYILNDDIPATESNGQNSTGKVPRTKKKQRPKENSTMQKEMTEEEKLAAIIEYIMNDDIPASELTDMTIVEGVSEETDSNASVTSAILASPLQNNFSLSSGTEKHQRAHSARNKETTEDEEASEDRDQTVKGHLHTGKLPRRPKTRNPKRMSANNTQSSLPAASTSRIVIRPKQDSNIQMASTASSGPRTNSRSNSTDKSKDTLILEDVESGDVASIASDASSVRAGTRLRKEHPTRQPKETDETILEIPARVSGASAENHTDVAASIKKTNSSTQSNNVKDIEEFNLDKAIEEILGIPAADFGASVENRTDVAANLKEKNSTAQPSKSKHTEEMDLDKAIEEIFGISTLGGEQAAEPNSMSKERKTNSREKATGQSHGMDAKKPTVQTISVQDIGSSGVETMNCDSECSVASGDTMRPMAVGSSGVKTSGGSASSKSKQTLPAILLKDETIEQKPCMRSSRETAEPSLGGLQGMETHRNAAVPVTSGNNSGTSPRIVYEPYELEQIERQFRCC